MKTLQELNFQQEQMDWVLRQIPNFKGVTDDENEARSISAKLAKESGETDFHVRVYQVWNGITGEGHKYGYTVGWCKPMTPLFKNGIEPAMIDDEINGATRL